MEMIELSNEDLLRRLSDNEDAFTERKSFKDKNGWLKTAIAFANSAPIGWPALLFIGVTPKGEVEATSPNLDELQKTLAQELDRAYPLLFYLPKVVNTNAGRQCLAVLIPGSENRPHFSGKSFVRVGSESREASESQMTELITHRNSKARLVLEWKGKKVTVRQFRRSNSSPQHMHAILENCNQFLRDANKN